MSAPHAPSSTSSQAMPQADSSGYHDQQHTSTQTEMGPLSFMNSSDTSQDTDTRSTVRTILVFSAVVAPLAFVPYVFVRQHTVRMDRKLASMQTLLTKEFKAARAHADEHHRKAVEHADAALEQTRKQLADVRSGIKGELVQARKHVVDEVVRESGKLHDALVAAGRVGDNREGRRRTWEADMRRKMDTLLDEESKRRAQLAAELKELGKSLADTAAFIEEVEMRQGWTPRPQDGRGIERMRSLGKRLQHFAEAAQQAQSKAPASSQPKCKGEDVAKPDDAAGQKKS